MPDRSTLSTFAVPSSRLGFSCRRCANPQSIFIEKALFLAMHGAAEDRVAVRKASEPADDVSVMFGPLQACPTDRMQLVVERYQT